ncbi:MAG: ABC transporter substrate-binding protein [Acidimicrobiales bacterium]
MGTISPRPRQLLLAVLVTLASVAAACASGGSTTTAATSSTVDPFTGDGSPTTGGRIVWGLEAETDDLNPITGRFALSGHMVASAIYDSLAALDDQGNAVPFLAEAIEPDDDFTTWRITLRPGIVFHDGSPLDAQAVAAVLRNYTESIMTSRALQDVRSVEVTGPLEVTVTTRQPWATFPYLLTTQAGYVPGPSMVRDPLSTPIGTGPFTFQDRVMGQYVRLRRNPDYWRKDAAGRPLPYLDGIEFRPLPDAQTRADQLVDGTLDAIDTASPGDIVRLRTTPGVKLLTYSDGEERLIMLNSGRPPFDHPTARLAVAAATDVARVREEAGYGIAVPTESLWAPGQLGYREDSGYPGYDPERARQLVKQYERETGQPLAFTYSADQAYVAQVQQLLKEMWEAAGMQVEVRTLSQGDLVIHAALGQYQASDWRFFGGADPDLEHVWLHSRNIDPSLVSLNFAQFGDPRIDAALDRGRATLDRQVRDEAYAEVARVLNENTPYIWIERVTWAIASRDEVYGYGPARNGSIQSLGPKPWIAELWKRS